MILMAGYVCVFWDYSPLLPERSLHIQPSPPKLGAWAGVNPKEF